MRATKFSLNASTPALPQERCFYTEADIRMIIKSAVQEVLSTILIDEEPEITANVDQKKPDKLTVTVLEAAEILGVSRPSMLELIQRKPKAPEPLHDKGNSTVSDIISARYGTVIDPFLA